MQANELPQEGFIRLKQVLAVFPVGESTWFKGVKEGVYPKPISLGGRMKAWKVQDIRDLIAKYQD